MNDRTMIHHIRRFFRPGFGKLVGADLVREAVRLRAKKPDLPASAILARWQGESSVSMTRVIHHPPGVKAPMALVAGRHTKCDLGSIPGASLRHALLLLWPAADEDDPPFAEVIDLGTQTGISLVDGRLAARMATSEPIRFGVAEADFVILHARAGELFPEDPTVLSELLGKVADRAEVTPHGNWPHTRYVDISGTADYSGNAGTANFSGTADFSRTADQAEGKAQGAMDSCVVMATDPGRAPTFGSDQLMLTRIFSLGEGHLNAGVCVRVQDLERGVRLGRYSRCRGSSVLGRDKNVSRVHALVLQRGGRRWLFDTASTNGTKVIEVETGEARGPVRGERTFALLEGQAPSLAGQVALLSIGAPEVPS